MNLGSFYKGKKVLVTGHTGFKGAWLSLWLKEMDAKVIGYALDPENKEDLFNIITLKDKIIDLRGDIRDLKNLKEVIDKYDPEIIFHLAAQALVRRSYEEPHYTFETNLMGSINILEALKSKKEKKSVIIITSDKCYKNKNKENGYTEEDELGGIDPYSASKSCAEIAVLSYMNSFFTDSKINIATTRAGNVIGGGDWAKDRIMTDCITALEKNQKIEIRNPEYIRPWQHVLDPLYGYLLLGMKLFYEKKYSGAWNFGPDKTSMVKVKEVVEMIIKEWGKGEWVEKSRGDKKKESKVLMLDSSKAREELGWYPHFNLKEAVNMTAEWYKKFRYQDPYELTKSQLLKFN